MTDVKQINVLVYILSKETKHFEKKLNYYTIKIIRKIYLHSHYGVYIGETEHC